MTEWLLIVVVSIAAAATVGPLFWWVARSARRSRPLSGWTTEYRGRGSLFDWPIGTDATFVCGESPTETARVRIDSKITRHKGASGDQLVCDVIFLESATTPGVVYAQGKRYPVPADMLEPNVEVLRQHREIAALIEADTERANT